MKQTKYGFTAWQGSKPHGGFYHAQIEIMRIEPRRTPLFSMDFYKDATKLDDEFSLVCLNVHPAPECLSCVQPIMKNLRAQIDRLKGLKLANDYDCFLWACRQLFTEVC